MLARASGIIDAALRIIPIRICASTPPGVIIRIMAVEHTYEIVFQREHVPHPVMCEMSRACRDVMFNIDYLSVSRHDALMTISVVGDIDQVNRAEQFFKKAGADVRLKEAGNYTAPIPAVPVRTPVVRSKEPPISKKVWLTIVGSLRRQPLFWVLSRRYDVTFKIYQSVTGNPVSILCLVLIGPLAEVDGAIQFLREQGVDVEMGEIRPGEE